MELAGGKSENPKIPIEMDDFFDEELDMESWPLRLWSSMEFMISFQWEDHRTKWRTFQGNGGIYVLQTSSDVRLEMLENMMRHVWKSRKDGLFR